MQNLEQLLTVLTISKTTLKLVKGDSSTSIPIKSLENLLELSHIVGIGLHSNCHQGHLLELLGTLESSDVADIQSSHLCSVR